LTFFALLLWCSKLSWLETGRMLHLEDQLQLCAGLLGTNQQDSETQPIQFMAAAMIPEEEAAEKRSKKGRDFCLTHVRWAVLM
jgi:hypothetical protein